MGAIITIKTTTARSNRTLQREIIGSSRRSRKMRILTATSHLNYFGQESYFIVCRATSLKCAVLRVNLRYAILFTSAVARDD